MLHSDDPINPSHYKSTIPNVECIDVTKHMDFCTGNAMKYIWRHEHKGKPTEDLEKAIWYLQKKIEMLKEGEGAKL